ncbi:ATP-binding cassette domain-containing protein [Paenibacillus beijingensis]|uniref:ABC transporter domain-containing protein n=1 Tax=Paenibacillus beijingensis TaxID=1126833 RepID=A0A0D5NEM7_9BACL|nr:ABC transporter ATP-binding protein [Paenibacillus beijingensis]AJY73681.1 hypothetical protein VN24_02335 [Paenibacillus beijingensis]
MLELKQVRWHRQGYGFTLAMPNLIFRSGITLLAGSNGSGKTSLLQLLATAAFPSEGMIRYGDMTTDRHLPAIRASIGFVPTGLELYEDMTCEKILRYLAELKGETSRIEHERLLETFHLNEFRKRKIKSLAHGVRQRIALAQAWIGSPSYIFLDEPLNAMDSLERLRFIRYLSAYARDRVVIVSTHELNEWDAWAGRILWLRNGRPGFHGTTEEWCRSLPLSIWEGAVTAADYESLPPASVLQVRPEGATLSVRIIAGEQPGPLFKRQPPTLEDAYFIRSRAV